MLWNGNDPILKERLFGLTNSEGNHGEDVKEYYFYLDSTPTHSYMKYLYKYPHAAFPYDRIVKVNKERTRTDFEYELLDTGVFADDRYFDVFVEYAKETPEDLAIRITVANRGPEEASIHLLPSLWFRNTWSWKANMPKPSMHAEGSSGRNTPTSASLSALRSTPELLFTENETNTGLLWKLPNTTPYVKDAFHQYVVNDAAKPSIRSGAAPRRRHAIR